MKGIVIALSLLLSTFTQATSLEYATSHTIASTSYGSDRTFYIKLAKSYADKVNRRYPVLYVLHGQWDMLPAVATLALLDDAIPDFLVVGVDVRGQELRPSELADAKPATLFSRFLRDELVPYITKNYRVADYKILSGHSNAGRFVLNNWLDNGTDFSAYYAFSPSLEDRAINVRLEKTPSKSLAYRNPLTITLADEGEHMQQPFQQISEQLSKILGDQFNAKTFPSQSHSSTRHESLRYALMTTFFDWQPPYETKIGPFSELVAHYEGLAKRYGFEVTLPLDLLQRLSAHYAMSNKAPDRKKVSHIINYGLGKDKTNGDAFIEIADYLKANDNKLAGHNIMTDVCRLLVNHRRCSH